MSQAFGCLSLLNGCRLIAAAYTVWSFLNFIFTLATFSSPNFAILVNYKLLPQRVDTFGRMWYSLASLTFWVVHIIVDILLFVGVTKGHSILLPPFVVWCVVGALWETFFVAVQIAEYSSTIQIFIILYSLAVNVVLPVYFALVVLSYAEVMREGQLPTDAVILKNAVASSHEDIARLNDSNVPKGEGGIRISSNNRRTCGSIASSKRSSTSNLASANQQR